MPGANAPVSHAAPAMTVQDYRAELKRLAPRELEALVLAAKGFSMEESATLMGVKANAVSVFRSQATGKLKINLYAACALVARADLA